jgi:uncharacterized protein DUF4386
MGIPSFSCGIQMITSAIDESQRKAARVAGLLYLITFVAVVYANFGIHDRLNVAGNAAATAQKILANERLFRIGIACDLIYSVGLVALLAALYVILKPVSPGLALVSTLWKLVYAVAWLVMSLQFFDALRLMHGAEYLRVFEPARLQALAKLYLAARFDRYYGGLLFYALGGTVASYLFLKSNFIPRALAVAGVIAFAWCAFCTFVFFIFPNFTTLVNLWWFDTPMGLFEIALSFWLLFKGLSPSVRSEATS